MDRSLGNPDNTSPQVRSPPMVALGPTVSINHAEVNALSDSAASFEGPEKLLEIWFASSHDKLPTSAHSRGLMAIPCEKLAGMLDIVQCKVLSTIQSSTVDAYLLSESSMFVFPHKIILKTCGTTMLLIGLSKLLELAHEVGLHKVHRVFYSRKSFMFPDRQPQPHRSWDDEVSYLNTYFGNGSAYLVGMINGDHWHLYLTSPDRDVNDTSDTADETLEILMSDICPVNARQFYSNAVAQTQGAGPMPNISEGHILGMTVARSSGLSDVFHATHPDAKLDAYVFDPCGFSANGVVPCDRAPNAYFTVHVTPEPVCSYASFETNVPCGSSPKDVINSVVSIFRPGKFSVSYFDASPRKRQALEVDGYLRKDRIMYDLADYELMFASFELRS